MDDFPAKIAGFLEAAAQRIRAMTVDRVRTATTWAGLSLALAVLALLLLTFLFVGIFRLLGELIGVKTAYAAIGGLFVLVGAFLWSKRIPPTSKATDEHD